MLRRRGLLPILCFLAAITGVLSWEIHVGRRSAALNARLSQAVSEGDAASAERLLRQGANPNAKPSDLNVMWHSVGSRFLVNPANWDELISTFRSGQWEGWPVIWSVKDPRMVRILLAHGATPDLEGPQGGTALMRAASYGNAAVVRALLAGGAKVDHRARDGSTALCDAVQALQYPPEPRSVADHHYPDVIRALIAAGADVNAKTIRGRSVLKIAKRSGRPRYVELLKKAGAKE